MRRGYLAALGMVICCLLFPPVASAQDSKPTKVRVGVLVNDIQQLDLQSHSYNVDLYMWFKWRNPSRSGATRSTPRTSWLPSRTRPPTTPRSCSCPTAGQ